MCDTEHSEELFQPSVLKAGDIVLELEGVDVTTGHPIDIIEAILLGRTGCCPLNPTGNVSQVDWTE